jgi:antitoxin component of RelBE/YafQ-DinJ toxin-antitoxin module
MKLSITIDDNIYNALDDISDKIGIRKSKLIEMSLTGHKTIEDIEIEEIIKEVKKDNTWHSLDDVRREMGL